MGRGCTTRFVVCALLVQAGIGAPTSAFAAGPDGRGDVVINEIAYAWPGEAMEFIELYNRSPQEIDLSGLTLSDDRRVPVPVPVTGRRLAPDAYLVLVNRLEVFERLFPGVPAIQVPSWPVLNNGRDAVVVELRGMVVDSVYYDASWGGQTGSLERRNPHVLVPVASNWGSSTHPSGGTPGSPNSILVIDQAAPIVLEAEEESPHLILARASEPLDPASLHPSLLRVDGRSPLSVTPAPDMASFRLSLSQPLGEGVLEVGRIRDLAGNEASPHVVQIAAIPRPGEIVLNEIMYDPRIDPSDGLPDQTEYVELMNVGTRLLRLRGLQFAEDPNESGFLGSTPVTNAYAQLPPAGLAVVYASRFAAQTGDRIPLELEPFADDAGDDAIWLGVSTITSRGLNNSGQPLRLISPSGGVLDAVHYEPFWHSLTLRGLSQTRGVALERIDPAVAANLGENWSSSRAASGGTPGRINTVHQSASAPTRLSTGIDAYPSPFSPDDDGFEDVTYFDFRLHNDVSMVRITVFDTSGRIVRRLSQAEFTSGNGTILWDGKDDRGIRVAMGMYVVLLEGITAETASTERHKTVVSVARGR